MKEIEKQFDFVINMWKNPHNDMEFIHTLEMLKKSILDSLSVQSSKGISDEEIYDKAKETQDCPDDTPFWRGHINGFKFGAKWMRSKLSEGSKTNGWVDVKDRLPKRPEEKEVQTSEWVIVSDGKKSYPAFYGFISKQWNCELKVTHWIPLPLPPNELSNQTDAVETSEEVVKKIWRTEYAEYIESEEDDFAQFIFKKYDIQ